MKIDYINTDTGADITIWKRGKDRKRQRFSISNFRPSFFVPDPDGKFMSVDHQRLKEVMVSSPSDIPELRREFAKAGISHYQADVMFSNRFLIDADQNKVKEYFDEGPARILYLDTEAIKVNDVWELICWTVYDNYEKVYETHLQALADECLLNEMFAAHDDVYLHESGRELLIALLDLIVEIDPDIITGWNVQWDMVEPILKYANSIGVSISRISPEGITSIGHAKREKLLIHGRDIFDLLSATRLITMNKEKSYALRHIAKQYLGIDKPDHRGNFLDLLTNNPKELVRYNRDVDVVSIVELDKKLRITDTFLEQQKEYMCQLNSVFAVSTMIDIGLQRTTELKRLSRGQKGEQKLRGPLNIKPKIGVYHGALTIDFRGMYSTIMLSYNMSPETFDPHGDLRISDTLAFWSKPEGLMSSFIRKTIEMKDHYGTLRDEAKKKGNMDDYQIFKARRDLYKIIANATYGITASDKTGWYYPEIASSILTIARQLLSLCIKRLEEKGYQVIYGHTDSMTVVIGWENEEKFLKECEELTEWVNTELNIVANGMGLTSHQFEVGQDYKWKTILMTGAHNQYAGYLVDGELITVGLIKGIFSDFAERFTTELIEKVLREEDADKIEDWVRSEIGLIATRSIPLDRLAFCHTLRKKPEEYLKRNAFVEGIKYSNEKFGFNLSFRDTQKFLPVEGLDVNQIAIYMYDSEIPKGIEPNLRHIVSLNVRSRAKDLLKIVGIDIKVLEVWKSLLPHSLKRRRKRIAVSKSQTKMEDFL